MHVLILICAAALSHSDCNANTARAAIQGPQSGNLAMCGFAGQAMAGNIAVRPVDGEYVKIICVPPTANGHTAG